MSLYERVPTRALNRPVLVIAMEGWIDAGLGAATAVAALLAKVPTEVLATWDNDALLDHRARRPTMRIVDGVAEGLAWPEISLRFGVDEAGNDVVVLSGPEPDMHWRRFTDAVVELALDLEVRLAIGMGAFPSPVPHTRPVRLAATASTPELAQQVGFVPGAIEVPAPIQAVIEQALGAAGIAAVGLWARVPHYASAMPYPGASAALLESLATIGGIVTDVSDLHAAARTTRERIDALIANSGDHGAMVNELERQADEEERSPFGPGDLPTGDDLAAELERFLRGELG